MAQRTIALLSVLALTVIPAASAVALDDMKDGCCTRPACGKMCKLVCDTTTITVTCYGCECDEICIPGRSKPGCKRCESCCSNCGSECVDTAGCCSECGNDCCEAHTPKCVFCWRNWCPIGCGKPITVKKLTKYQAEKEVCSYHWEVVDGCCCDCGAACGDGCCEPSCSCVYKEAPADAQVGDTLELTKDELIRLTASTSSRRGGLALQQIDVGVQTK